MCLSLTRQGKSEATNLAGDRAAALKAELVSLMLCRPFLLSRT